MKPETILQNQIRCELSKHGTVIRMNSGLFLTADGRPVKNGIPGIPDLLFLGKNGFSAWIEVKTETGALRPEQENFLRMLKKNGHRAGIARSVDEALQIIGAPPNARTPDGESDR